MLGVDKPDPATADNELNSYVFERRVDMPQPDGKINRGFIDLYRRDCFVLEGKQSNQKLDSGSWDKAMFRAYGWDDLAESLVGKPGATTPLPDKPEAQAQAEEELLSRLVDLNAKRAAEEAKGKIRWLRPEFQAPDSVAVESDATTVDTPDTQQADTAKAAKSSKPEGKLTWPKVLQDQIKVVREQLALSPLPADALTVQFKRNPKGVQDVLDALVALGMVTEEGGEYRLV